MMAPRNLLPEVFPPAALDWLSNLITERVSPALRLFQEESSIVITVPGSDCVIRFVGVVPTLRGASLKPLQVIAMTDSSGILRTRRGRALLCFTQHESLQPHTVTSLEGVTVYYDAFGLIFWCLCRVEELQSDSQDSHGRFAGKNSHAFQNGYLDRPVVDEWLNAIADLAYQVWPTCPKPTVLDRPLLDLSHDVDYPSRYAQTRLATITRNLAKDFLQQRAPITALKGLVLALRSLNAKELLAGDPYNTFNWIMDRSESVGVRSCFYFICGGDHPLDPGYNPRSKVIRGLIKQIHKRGHRIGLHPSYQASVIPGQIGVELDVLMTIAEQEGIRQKEWGIRMHYLRCRYPDLWETLDGLPISHDATMGYADVVGFRAGTAYDYPAFHPMLSKRLKFRVRPLLVMDGTLTSSIYMASPSNAHSLQIIHEIRDTCQAEGGTFALLWHNSELSNPMMQAHYESAIAPLHL